MPNTVAVNPQGVHQSGSIPGLAVRTQSAQSELAGEGDVAPRETEWLQLIVERARPYMRVVAHPNRDVLDERCEPVGRHRLAPTGLPLSLDRRGRSSGHGPDGGPSPTPSTAP